MIKVMIVDDEYYFKQAIRVIISWEELGFEIIGEAKNGEEALKKIDDLEPDIVLVDINMPVMDGLEFIRTVKEKKSNVKFIILTGHSEFNYARQALQLCVENYLLKPIDEDELKKALFETRDIIERESNIKLEMDSLKKQVKDSIPLQRDMLLNELIRGNYMSPEEIKERANYLGINLSFEFYRVLAIGIDLVSNHIQNEDTKQLCKFAVSNVVGEFLSKAFTISVFFDNNDNVCVLLCSNDDKYDDFSIKAICERIKDIIFRHFTHEITIGIGNSCREIKQIPTSYREALYALKNKLAIGKNSVILHSEVDETGLITNYYTVEHRNQLLMDMRLGSRDMADAKISEIFYELRIGKAQHNLILLTCIELVSTCIEFLAETKQSYINLFKKSFNPLEDIQSKNSINELEIWIKDLFMQTINFIHRNKNTRYAKIMEDVKNYVRKNYCKEDLRIDEIAASVYVNYTHLCYVFKKETGMTINDYLTEVRIKKAKELIDNGNYILSDVAEKVGYADTNYFGKCFKKRYGLPPTKYIENLTGIKQDDL